MGNAEMRCGLDVERTKSACKPVRALTASILAGLQVGCAVGPDFKRPTAAEVSSHTVAPLPAQTASAPTSLGEVQYFSAGASANVQ